MSTALVATTLGMTTTTARAATDTDPDFMLIEEDLEHILKQIQIAEAHAAGGQLLCNEPTDTSGKCVPDPALPLGLRTVDGSYNNLEHPTYGKADEAFPTKLPRLWRGADEEQPVPPYIPANNPDHMDMCEAGKTCYSMHEDGHHVYDADPRIISNLIVDQTDQNPAAVNAQLNQADAGAVIEPDGDVFLPNTAPDEALSAPFNAWFTFFGQFFDHGLDLVNKGSNGTLVVPLQPDDPLYNDPRSVGNFLTLTRATRLPGPDGIKGTADDRQNNQTTPFIDQNQTYTSHPAHQVFLREYELVDGKPRDTGRLLDGTLPGGGRGGLATWNDVKAQAREILGINLVDADVLNVPQIVTDPYGNFVPGGNGFPLLAEAGGTVEGNRAAPISTSNALRTNHAFLDDIAHGASPADLTGYSPALLGDHFVTGDGRGNENIGLTAVHHVFHSEHNRMVGEIREILARDGNEELEKAFMGLDNDYEELLGEELPDGPEADDWTFEQRLFQAAKFPTEMQYQHLVFEEFARKVQPAIDPIVLNENSYDATINPAIRAEFAHVVYRFGHSMLTEDIERTLHEPGAPAVESVSLLDGFLNPRSYDANGTLTPDQAAGSIVNGTTNQVAGQIDEFVVDTLRNNLLGLPLDLATINLLRGRDAGVPSLQAARATFFEESGDPMLKPYDSWVDFGLSLKNGENFGRSPDLDCAVTPADPRCEFPNASLVNFVAAYGKHPDLLDPEVDTVVEKRAVANEIVNGGAHEDFMNGTGDWAPNADGETITGLEDVDFWIGGLAEALEPFGGMLGSTFNYVFEKQLEDLQFGDRFYYLFRNQGNQLFAALEANSFAGLIQRNTDASLLPADIFSVPNVSIDLEDLPTPLPEGLVHMADGTYRWDGDEHVEIHGHRTDADQIRGGQGDDSLWGYGGNDRIEGGSGNDGILGGPGDDILTDTFGDDNIKGGFGNDAIKGGSGDDLLLGGHGRDFVATGNDFKSVFSGTGNDVVVGGNGRDTVFAGEGDDWIEGGGHADLMQGDNANQFQNNPHGGNDVVDGGPGNDDIEGEGGDDILVGRPAGTDRHEGMHGYDWVTYRGDTSGVDVDLRFTVLQRPDNQAVRDRFDLIEAISGGAGDDVIRGMGNEIDDVPNLNDHKMTQETLDLIDGLEAMLDPGHETNYAERFMVQPIGFDTDGSNNLLLGGSGSDRIQSRAGNDFIDGDAYLDVYLMAGGTRYNTASDPALQAAVFNGTINPGNIEIVRKIVVDGNQGDVMDTAVFGASHDAYSIRDLGDGYWEVSHDLTDVEPEEAEGSDILRNVELLSFADGCFVLETMVPCGSYGVASLEYTPPATENEAITARVVFNGIPVDAPTDIRFRWLFAEEEDVTGAEEWLAADVHSNPSCSENADGFLECVTTYRPGDLVVDNLLRVEVTFLDDDGVLRSILSPMTTEMVVNVNDVPARPVLDDQTPMVGEVVRVSGLADEDGLDEAGETLQWVWQTSVTSNPNGAYQTVATKPYHITGYLPTPADAGRYLRVMATYTDDHGTDESPTSLPTENTVNGTVLPPDPTAPAAPALVAAAVAGPDGVTVSWQAPQNDGGSPITGYRVKARQGNAVVKTVDVDAGKTSVLVTGLSSTASYTFSVAAMNAAGMGPESVQSGAVTLPAVVKQNSAATGRPKLQLNGKKTALKAGLGSVADGNGMSSLTWGWERKTAKGWKSVAASGKRLKVTDKLRGRLVRSVVSFVDADGFQEVRTSKALRVPRVEPGRPEVRAESGARGGAATIKVRWSKPDTTGGWSIQGYRVVVVNAATGRVAKQLWVGPGHRSVTVKVPAGAYKVWVQAKNRAGFGSADGTGRVMSL